MVGNPVTVVAEGKIITVDQRLLRPGDIVILQAGDLVPADLTLVEGRMLEVDEFEITGELLPVIKEAENRDPVYQGSKVIHGTGKGVAVAVGDQTELGKVLSQVREWKKPGAVCLFRPRDLWIIGLILPALVLVNLQIGHMLILLAISMVISLVLIFLQNDELFAHLLLQLEMKIIRRHRIHIADPEVLRQLKSADLVCFDKTGVLTTRRMDVTRLFLADRVLDPEVVVGLADNAARLVMLACALCHDVQYVEKIDVANPIDKALIAFARKHGVEVDSLLDEAHRIFHQPFDPEKRCMAVGFELGRREYYFSKGDPLVILHSCNQFLTPDGEVRKVASSFRRLLHSNLERIYQEGGTAIALAYADDAPEGKPSDYIFLGLVQFENSLQAAARQTVQRLAESGIRSILATGDRSETAVRVASASGIALPAQACLTGAMIDRMDYGEVARQSDYVSVFARLTPSQKGILIRILQRKGHCVVMLGDGPNDGIALKAADVSISIAQDSSPIARRLAKILINDLGDTLTLITSARRLWRRNQQLKVFRVLLAAAHWVGIYLWAFEIVYLQRGQ